MLFSDIAEVSSILPTSKWKDLKRLMPMIEDEEDATLTPILGGVLLEKLNDKYHELTSGEEYESLAEIRTDGLDEADRRTVRLLRTCQAVILFGMLAHNRAALSTSFNAGGGFNRMSAEDYSQADDKALKDLDREFYGNLHRKIDLLLSQLEQDAEMDSEHQLWATEWKKSNYFYLKSDLIFTRADIMQEFMDIKQSREKFISLVPDIRYVQLSYIESRIQPVLFRQLLRASTHHDDVIVAIWDNYCSVTQAEDTELTEERRLKITAAINDALRLMRMAAAQYVMARTATDRQSNYQSSGDMSMAKAVEFIAGSEWLTPTPPPQPEVKPKEECKCSKKRRSCDDAIFVFGGRVDW